MTRRPAALLSLATALTVVAALAATPTTSAQAAVTVCDQMSSPITQVVKPASDASLLTRWPEEAAKAARNGFTEDRGTPFAAAARSGAGLVPVHRLYRSSIGDFLWVHQRSQIDDAVERFGYADQGVSFYASPAATSCTVPVERFVRSAVHRFAVSAAERAALIDDGWRSEGVGFHAVADQSTEPSADPSTDPVFSVAVMPDTQQEVLRPDDHRFVERSRWLVDHRSSLDLRFVTHVGDVVNWDTADHAQTKVASRAMEPLEAADIPYSLSIGNHDSQATGVGGGARNPRRTRELQRDTSTFNSFFTASRYGAVRGAFEAGKVDNIYSTFEAGGDRWLVLNLELWPRTSVVGWARDVVADHPDHNVIVVTHSYLNGDGGISSSKDYGDNSGRYLFEHLVKVYPNVKIVLSGHVGRHASRTDTGVHGNKIVSYLQTFHSNTTNPVRLLEIDTAKGTVSSRVYGPKGDQRLVARAGQAGMDWVRPSGG